LWFTNAADILNLNLKFHVIQKKIQTLLCYFLYADVIQIFSLHKV